MLPGDDCELGFGDEPCFDDDDADSDGGGGWRLGPEWLHADCLDPCAALDLGTCCKYPAEPLVSRATALADSVDRTAAELGRAHVRADGADGADDRADGADGSGDGADGRAGGCAAAAGELARLLMSVPGLLAQIHAVLPGMSRTAAAQLTCPVGRLGGVADLVCLHGCPWACGDPGAPGRRCEFEPLRPLLEACSEALWAVVAPRGPARPAGFHIPLS
jgi:hypothetical protein